MWLLDIIYSINAKLSNRPKVFERLKINSVIRFCLRLIANNVLPICYKLSKQKVPQNSVPVIVSLTSFPVRIGKVWMVIEAMLRQTVRAEKIILWLSRDQFPGEIADLPKELVTQTHRGLVIRFVDGDIRSHKKYYYVFHEFPDKYILTIDDDLLFPSTFINETYHCALRNPSSVIAHFGSIIYWSDQDNYIHKEYRHINTEETGNNFFFGSGGGTLFPPNTIASQIDDISTILSLCPTADDIYLNAISRIANCLTTFRSIFPLLSLKNKNDKKLHDQNGNLFSPQSVNAIQLRAVIDHFISKFNINPFNKPPYYPINE